MIILDVNILLYAFNANCAEHTKTFGWLEETVRSGEVIYLPWVTVLGFLRLSTNSAIYSPPYTPNEALRVLEDLLKNQNVRIVDPATISLEDFKTFTLAAQVNSKLYTDAYLAALAIQTGSVLVSADLGFARFQSLGLNWQSPLGPSYVAERPRRVYKYRRQVTPWKRKRTL